MLADRPAHRLARLRVLERVVGRALRETETLCADTRPRVVEDAHRDLEAVSLLAEQVRGWDAAVVEEDLAGRRALDAHLRLDAADLEAGRVCFENEGGDTGVAAFRIGLREHGVHVRDAGVRDEALAAVEDVLAVVQLRRRA